MHSVQPITDIMDPAFPWDGVRYLGRLSKMHSADTSANIQPTPQTLRKTKQDSISPWVSTAITCVPPVMVLGAAFAGVAAQPNTILLGVAFYLLCGVSITAGYHRLYAHRAYDAHVSVQMFFAFFGAGAFEGSIKWWGRNHRLHHRHVDTNKDPYNATRRFSYSHIGAMIGQQDSLGSPTDVNDFNRMPVVVAQHNFYFPIAMGSGIILPTLIAGLGWSDWLGGFFYAALAKMVVAHLMKNCTFFVNSLAQSGLFGAHASIICALLTDGESHHYAFPHDYRNGNRWYHYDPTKWLIRGLSLVGLTTGLQRFLAKLQKIEAKPTTLEPAFPRAPPLIRGLVGNTGRRSRLGITLARCYIGIVRSVAPLALLRVVYLALATDFTTMPDLGPLFLLDTYCVIETIFLGVSFRRARRLSRRRLPIAVPAPERANFVEKVIWHLEQAAQTYGCVDPADGTRVIPGKCSDNCPHTLLRGWQRGIPWNQVSKEQTQSWMCWAMFSSNLEEISSCQEKELSQALTEVTRRTGIKFPREHPCGDHPPIRLSLDEMRWYHRPLAAYVMTHLFAGKVLLPLILRAFGFRRVKGRLANGADVRHWFKPGRQLKSDDKSADGIVFIHGIGAGPIPYVGMLSQMFKATGLPILVVEVPHIALRWADPDLRGPDATAEAITTVLRSVRMERACVVGHSFGTLVAAWLLRHCPTMIHSYVFIDPICLLLARADCAFSAFHHTPTSAPEVISEYFVFRELSIAATLARNFTWHRNVIWADQLSNKKSVAILSEDDHIVPAKAVRGYLSEHEIPSVWLDGIGHGGFLFNSAAMTSVVKATQKVSMVQDTEDISVQ